VLQNPERLNQLIQLYKMEKVKQHQWPFWILVFPLFIFEFLISLNSCFFKIQNKFIFL
jgi:hypothetical protein